MSQETISQVRQPRGQAGHSRQETPTGAAKRTATGLILVWAGVLVGLVTARLVISDESIRRHVLQGLLLIMAAGEGQGSFSNIFRPRWFAEQNGRPYDPAYHGVSQDFGFYNLAFALLFALAALDPVRSTTVIAVAIVSYGIHGVTHVLRYFEVYYGGGTPIPTRSQHIEMAQGLPLVTAAAGMLLFFP
jgi:hypothetical protein